MYRSFYLYPLKSGIYCAEILNTETGTRIASKSTGSRKRDEAVLKAGEWLRTSIPTGCARKPCSIETVFGLGNVSLIGFLEEFWDYEKSS
jgi:hypothetical protein